MTAVVHQPLTWSGRSTLICIIFEFMYKYRYGVNDDNYLFYRCILIGAFFLCTIPIFLDAKQTTFCTSEQFRSVFSFLHMIDSISIFLIGLGMYCNNKLLYVIGVLFCGKFMYLALASRMVTGNKVVGVKNEIEELMKVFTHHFGSFLLLNNPAVMLITAFWRAVSISGHAVLALKRRLDPQLYDQLNWALVHARSAAMFIVLALIFFGGHEIRTGFAESAFGHIAYMTVRLSAVFRMGSIYLTPEVSQSFAHPHTISSCSSNLFYYLSLSLYIRID